MSDSITREEMLLNSIANSEKSNLSPITREEQYLSYIAGETNTYPIKPITRKEFYLDKIAKSGISGGGIGINVQPITIKKNGTYYAPQGIAYSPIIVDVQVGNGDTSVLEGDGQDFHQFAPTSLTFKSQDDLADFQEVQIDGETLDPSNYTLTEGSTIVTLSPDYLKTLGANTYKITIVSTKGKTSANFSVTKPELNEYGFYYNQPYTANVPAFGGKTVFFMREGGVMDVLVIDNAYTEVCNYTANGNNLIIQTASGTFTGVANSDGIHCNELSITFALGDDSVVADEDYIYIYNTEANGYVAQPIEKNKSYYAPIKTGITNIPTTAFAIDMFRDNTNLLTVPQIPDSVWGIASKSFSGCTNLTEVIVPDSIIAIGVNAFSGCTKLSSVVLPANVQEIYSGIFYDCTSLTNITFKGTVAQWNAVNKVGDWLGANVPATYVQCSDGQVAL